MKKIKGILQACIVIALLCFGMLNGNVYAEETPDHHLGIVPTQSNLGEIKPGETYYGSFKIKNQGKKDSSFEIDFAPYSVKGENYDPIYSEESVYTEISKWITTEEDGGTIAPGSETEIHYTINVPSDAHGGSQSAIIIVRLKTDDASSSTAVNTVQQLGYLIFGNVDGEITKTGKILENKIPSFLFNPPIMATSLVENTGNVYTTATYKLQVFPLFGDEEVYTNEETPENSIVFPETKRYNEIRWEGAPQLGIFRVRQTVSIFDTESVEEKLVFLCPIWFLFIVILLVFLIIFWIISRIIRRREA